MDGIVLCGTTAETLLEHKLITGKSLLDATDIISIPSSSRLARLRDEGSWPISIDGCRFNGIDVLVPGKNQRRQIPHVRYHSWSGDLPAGAFARIAKGLYLTTAPFMALQAARAMDTTRLVQYIMYLTGHYCLHQDSYLQERPSLATLEQIDRMRHSIDGTKGSGTLAKALPYCSEGARSPQEVNMFISAVFPRPKGAYRLPIPLINHRIELDSELAGLMGSSFLEIDLFWPDGNIGLEYNGIETHQGGLSPRDLSRQYVLAEQGIDILFVTKEQLYNAGLLDIVMRAVAKRLGISTRPKYWPHLNRVQELLDTLSGTSVN